MDKNAIKKFAVWARTELRDRVTKKIDEYAISAVADPNADSVRGRLLTKDEKEQRAKLIGKVKEKGMDQVVEEGAYTWFNRFSALRFMEVNGYLPSHVRVFTDEDNDFKPQILAEAIHLDIDGLDMEKVYAYKDVNQTEELYKYLLITQCNALGELLPGMFQRIADYTELLFPDNLLRDGSVIQQMIELLPENDFKVKIGGQIEIIGWLYQYYNTEQNECVYDGSMAKSRLCKELLPAATTIYTPDWAVHYMVENSLGRLWAEGHPNTTKKCEWKYYLEEIKQATEVQNRLSEIRKEYESLKPDNIRVIDPCSGSGHICIYLFDVLMQIYEDYGIQSIEAVRSIIENNLWGLDIDDRAAQLAYFSVMMKAVQYDNRFLRRKDENGDPDIPQPHIYAIRESNYLDSFTVDQFVNGDVELKKDMDTLINELHDAKEYGSILNVTQVNFDALYKRFDECRTEVSMYQKVIEQDLYPFVQVAQGLAQKYDVIVTNPPYLSNARFSAKLDKYIKKNYLEEKSDLSMVMYRRTLDSFAKQNGFVSFITTNSWMVLSRFEKMREYVLSGYSFDSIVDFGTELFDGKVGHNPIVAWVNRKTNLNSKITAIRLVDYCYSRRDEKEKEFFNKDNYFYSQRDDFSVIPGSPITYSFSQSIINSFHDEPSVSDVATTRLGMTTADNNRFVRLWFEVDINKCIFNASSDDQVQSLHKKWVPYNKGGKYRKWYGNHDCVVNWENSGYEIKNFADDNGHIRSTVPNTEYYFIPCATWSKISSGSIAFRYRPQGSIFDVAGACLYSNKGLFPIMGFLNSNVADKILSVLSPTLNYEGSHIASLPINQSMFDDVIINNIVEENIKISKKDWDSYEFSWDFKRHPLAQKGLLADIFEEWKADTNERFQKMKSNEEELNRRFIYLYGLGGEIEASVEDKNVTVLKANLKQDVISLISYAVGCMLGRYSLDVDGIAYAGGEWNADKYKSFIPDKDGILPICDDEYFDDDVVGQFEKFVKIVYGEQYLEANLKFISDALCGKGSSRENIRNYFLNNFYSDHCSSCAFGISGKRPIYWLFDSGKKNGFKCLIYMHRYQPDTIARIRTDYVHEQQARYRTAIEELDHQIVDAPTSERVRLNKQLSKLKDQAEEVRVYEEKIHHLADQMISIDLDDGVKHNYEIFQDVLAKIK